MPKELLDIFTDVEPFRYIEALLYGDGLKYSSPDGMVNFYFSPVNTTDVGNALLNFQDRYNEGKIPCFYKQEDYLNDTDLQSTIKGLGLDPYTFWLLIMFCLDYSYDVCVNGHCYPETTGSQIGKILSILNDDSETILTIKSKKQKVQITDKAVLSKIKEWIKSGYENEKEQLDKELAIEDIHNIFQDRQESNSVMIWLFATLLKYFLDRNTQNKRRKTKEDGVSLNKLSLISSLIYHTRLSRNKNFLDDDEALKGFMKQYKNKDLKGYSPIYH